jgi:hypothetical protein
MARPRNPVSILVHGKPTLAVWSRKRVGRGGYESGADVVAVNLNQNLATRKWNGNARHDPVPLRRVLKLGVPNNPAARVVVVVL